MLYFSGKIHKSILDDSNFGLMFTPAYHRKNKFNIPIALDSGAFTSSVDLYKYYKLGLWYNNLYFISVPDKIGDANRTLKLFNWCYKLFKATKHPLAFVAQDGIETTVIPWDKFDVFFVGGTSGFKFSPLIKQLCHEAKTKEKRVHVGRVNTVVRLQYANSELGADSVDGTYLAFGPNKNAQRMKRWMQEINQLSLPVEE